MAALLGRPGLAGTFIGHTELRIPDQTLAVIPGPTGSFVTEPAGEADPCADVFNADRDVTLIELGVVYASSTNSNRYIMAPPEEVTAGTGAWMRVGSHFDGSPTAEIK